MYFCYIEKSCWLTQCVCVPEPPPENTCSFTSFRIVINSSLNRIVLLSLANHTEAICYFVSQNALLSTLRSHTGIKKNKTITMCLFFNIFIIQF